MADAAAEKAGEAVKAVEQKIENVEAVAGDAVARAQAETDAAKKEADRIAAAALNTALGQELQSHRTENETWRKGHEERINRELERIPKLCLC